MEEQRKPTRKQINALEEYLSLWQKARQNLLQIAAERGSRQAKEDGLAQDEQLLDDAFVEKRDYSTEVKKRKFRSVSWKII